MWTWLQRVDYEQNINRWYAVGVQPALFEQVAVIRFWGSREKDYQQVMVQAHADEASAREAADRLIRAKVRRGYCIVGGYRPGGLDEGPGAG
jgi:predicted DNA-binding WGR domain protein